ncbi:MAG: DUF1800 domain-containing protein [Pseudomonadota bacterium]
MVRIEGRLQPVILLLVLSSALSVHAQYTVNSLVPIDADRWGSEQAKHLLERAGFGATPAEIEEFARLSPQRAVARLVHFESAPELPLELAEFEHSGVFDEGLDPFPPSRPATTALAAKQGHALGVKVKPSGNRPMQPIVNKFFYWLRASRLETDRVVYWWANRMVASPRPLQEKMALFWHGHFATNEDKVRDYRKMHQQLTLFHREGLGNFRDLLIGVAKDPAMLAFLDAGVNVKGSPNENFAREIMELFTMGVGNYSEQDIREAARAFTGWNFAGLNFIVKPNEHDATSKQVLGRKGPLDGVDVIDIILAQEVTATFLATKIYRFFAREDIGPELAAALGARFRDSGYDIADLVETIFLSEDFYSAQTVGRHIKGPVELVISTYRKLELAAAPGIPDFNVVTQALGQRLMHPPTVAGWGEGRGWITPGLLIERGNFILDTLLPNIGFVAPDRHAEGFPTGYQILAVHKRLRDGHDMATATMPADYEVDASAGMMSMSNDVDREEEFNTRYGSYRGWQQAIERVKPTPRHTARVRLTEMITNAELATPRAVVDYFVDRFFAVPLEEAARNQFAVYFEELIGSSDVLAARSFLEEPLRMLLHGMLSRPEYQLG